MKVLVFGFLALIAFQSASFADGFRCKGDGYLVKLYDRTDPKVGTRVPAVLVVSSEEEGTITVVGSEQLSRERNGPVVSYQGQGKQGNLDVNVSVVIQNERRPEGDTTRDFDAALTVSMSDGYTIHAQLECRGYRKR